MKEKKWIFDSSDSTLSIITIVKVILIIGCAGVNVFLIGKVLK